MTRLLTTAALAALLSTSALANSNELFVDQVNGNNNVVGSADNRATQDGDNNLMDVRQNGSNNWAGFDSRPNAAQGLTQVGNRHEADIDQKGNRNQVRNLTQDKGNRNSADIDQDGNDNTVVTARQAGSDNALTVDQDGNRNMVSLSRQVGDDNTSDFTQNGNDNSIHSIQGDFNQDRGLAGVGVIGACMGCGMTIEQRQNNNLADTVQFGANQTGDIFQNGNGNIAWTNQQPR